MPKPHAKSTLKEMKDYIRAKKLNKPEVKLGMKKAEMVAALKKMGHWDPKHDGASAPKSAPKPTKKVVGTQKKLGTKVKKQAPKKKPAPKKQAGANTVAGQLLDLPTDISEMIGKEADKLLRWDPFKSKNAPYNKWTPCLVFDFNGKNPKPYECYYVKKQEYERQKSVGGGMWSDPAVWIKSISGKDKGDIIAVGDMSGSLRYSDVKPTHLRFAREPVTAPSLIMQFNEKHRLIKNQPKKIQDYYRKPEYKDEMEDGDFVYDIVQKIKIKNGGRFIKLKSIPEIISTNVRLFR